MTMRARRQAQWTEPIGSAFAAMRPQAGAGAPDTNFRTSIARRSIRSTRRVSFGPRCDMPAMQLQNLTVSAGVAMLCICAHASGSPIITPSCEDAERPSPRERYFAALVSERARAIELAFGETFPASIDELRIVFVRSSRILASYDPETHTLFFSQRVKRADTPISSAAASLYWPWYEQSIRDLYPIIEFIDKALWTAILREAAHAKEQTWPHAQCTSFDVTERLPCEMLASAVATYTTQTATPMFNENPSRRSGQKTWENSQPASGVVTNTRIATRAPTGAIFSCGH